MPGRAFQFGPFLLSPHTRELRREGVAVPLPPKAFDTLTLLVEQRERAVAKQELLHALWPDVAVEESSLSQQVSLVRRALGQDGNGRTYIATVPRHGYRFVADVREIDSEQQPPVAARARRTLGDGLRVAAGFVAALALIALAAWVPWTRYRSHPASSPAFLQVTSDVGVESFPALSPDGSTVLYAVGPLDFRGESDIYLKSVTGRAAQNLTPDSPGADTQPAFSPDGQHIAFSADRDGGTDGGIYVMGRLGESVRRLTSFGYNPSWSPDGAHVVFASESTGADPIFRSAVQRGELWVVDTKTGESRRIGTGLQPQWSPHGQRIAYVDQGRVWTMRPEGTGARLLTGSPASWSPAWTPDGTHVYFCSARDGTMNVWRVRVHEQEGTAAGEPEPVTTPSTFVGHLSFAANGRALAFASLPATLNIRHFEFDPAAEQVVREYPPVTSGSWTTVYPAPSADGKWIAFHSGHWREDIWIVHPDGTGLRQLTDDEASDRVATWSPDGGQLAFYSNRDGHWRTWLIDADGSHPRPVTPADTRALSLTWSPDRQRVSAVVTEPGVRAYIIDPRQAVTDQNVQLLPRAPGGKVFHATSWSPDGSKLAGRAEGRPAVFVLSLADGRFTPVQTAATGARWLSDGRRLLVCNGSRFSVVDTISGRVKEVLSLEPHLVCAPAAGGYALSSDSRHLYVAPLMREGDVWIATFPDGLPD